MQWHGAKRRPPQCLLSAIPPQLHPPHRTKQIPSAPGFSSCQKSLVVNWWSIGNKNSRGFNVFHHLTLTRSLEPSTNLWSQVWESLGHRFSSLGCMEQGRLVVQAQIEGSQPDHPQIWVVWHQFWVCKPFLSKPHTWKMIKDQTGLHCTAFTYYYCKKLLFESCKYILYKNTWYISKPEMPQFISWVYKTFDSKIGLNRAKAMVNGATWT